MLDQDGHVLIRRPRLGTSVWLPNAVVSTNCCGFNLQLSWYRCSLCSRCPGYWCGFKIFNLHSLCRPGYRQWLWSTRYDPQRLEVVYRSFGKKRKIPLTLGNDVPRERYLKTKVANFFSATYLGLVKRSTFRSAPMLGLVRIITRVCLVLVIDRWWKESSRTRPSKT